MNFKFEKVKGDFKTNMQTVKRKMETAITAASNMVASMILQLGRDDIASSGNFGPRWTEGLHMRIEGNALENIRMSMYHDIPYAGIFEIGGIIHGNPLLWLPFSNSDAAGIPPREYPGGLVSVQGKNKPLLFSVKDKQPKYFGIESVTIPQKWHLRDIQNSVMGNFRQYYEEQFKKAT